MFYIQTIYNILRKGYRDTLNVRIQPFEHLVTYYCIGTLHAESCKVPHILRNIQQYCTELLLMKAPKGVDLKNIAHATGGFQIPL